MWHACLQYAVLGIDRYGKVAYHGSHIIQGTYVPEQAELYAGGPARSPVGNHTRR